MQCIMYGIRIPEEYLMIARGRWYCTPGYSQRGVWVRLEGMGALQFYRSVAVPTAAAVAVVG